MFIYKITNIINNKVYIGQTIRPVEDRFKRHINDATNNILDTHFARAIRKYGSNNFKYEIIDTASNQQELNLKEKYWIDKYDAVAKGYNETNAVYKCGGNTYQSKTKNEMKIISDKIRSSKLGNKNPNSKAIKCRNEKTCEEIFFDTVDECREYFNKDNHRFITTRVLHQTKSLYLGIWNISYIDDEYYSCHSKVDKSGIKIKATDKMTNISYNFPSVRKMSRELNINRNQINKHINNNEKSFSIENYDFIVLN